MAELQHWLDGVGPLARHGATALMAVAGVALWLLGRSMARPLGAFIGLLAGATAAMAVPMERYGPLAIIIGSFVGCITAWLLFRIWTGAVAATVAALLVFGGFLVWPEVHVVLGASEIGPLNPSEQPQTASGLIEVLKTAWHARWAELKETRGTITLAATTAAGLAGLVLGLLAPYWAVSGVCALLGTLMVVVSLATWWRMTGWPWPSFVADPVHLLAALGLITAAGLALQWIIFRSRSD